MTEQEVKKIIDEARIIHSKMFDHAISLMPLIGNVVEGNPEETNRRVIGKKFAKISGILSGQILTALKNNGLLLSLLGLRTITEDYINARYTFNHPSHQGDLTWQHRICKDYFDRTNNLMGYKNCLDKKNLKTRMEEVKLEKLHKTYTYLTDLHHLLLRAHNLHKPEISGLLTLQVIESSIAGFQDIKWCVIRGFKLKENKNLESEVKGFLSKVHKMIKRF